MKIKLNLVFNNHKCLSKNNTCRLYEHIHTIGWDKDKIAEEREKKKQINEQKKQDRINHDRTIIKCSCGGSYQNYQKKRHEESKKHQNVMNT